MNAPFGLSTFSYILLVLTNCFVLPVLIISIASIRYFEHGFLILLLFFLNFPSNYSGHYRIVDRPHHTSSGVVMLVKLAMNLGDEPRSLL